MNTVFLCYETDPQTGISVVRKIRQELGQAVGWIDSAGNYSRRVEEFTIGINSKCIREYNSVEDFQKGRIS